jgi:hypothetical protein
MMVRPSGKAGVPPQDAYFQIFCFRGVSITRDCIIVSGMLISVMMREVRSSTG